MKIVFTGGGSGGHFYPIIAVAEAINEIVAERNLVKPELFYIADTPYDERLLYENEIEFRTTPAGKVRNYSSIKNYSDSFKTLFGTVRAIFQLFKIFPDVVFSKGSYVSVPTVTAARILGIPVFIHESDAIPGKANMYAAKFAQRIAIAFPQAAEHFSRKDVVALVGQPVRRAIMSPATEGAHEFLGLDASVPVILILGGSQGASRINDAVLQTLPELIEKYQVIHQTGEKNFQAIKSIADVTLEEHPYKNRYKAFGYLNDLALRMSAGVASLVISRAGAGAIFEIASWKKPAILIPIPEDVSRDQRTNAYAYARTGAATVVEQENLTPHVLASEIQRLTEDVALCNQMSVAAGAFSRPGAARKIAEELVAVALKHEH